MRTPGRTPRGTLVLTRRVGRVRAPRRDTAHGRRGTLRTPSGLSTGPDSEISGRSRYRIWSARMFHPASHPTATSCRSPLGRLGRARCGSKPACTIVPQGVAQSMGSATERTTARRSPRPAAPVRRQAGSTSADRSARPRRRHVGKPPSPARPWRPPVEPTACRTRRAGCSSGALRIARRPSSSRRCSDIAPLDTIRTPRRSIPAVGSIGKRRAIPSRRAPAVPCSRACPPCPVAVGVATLAVAIGGAVAVRRPPARLRRRPLVAAANAMTGSFGNGSVTERAQRRSAATRDRDTLSQATRRQAGGPRPSSRPRSATPPLDDLAAGRREGSRRDRPQPVGARRSTATA